MGISEVVLSSLNGRTRPAIDNYRAPDEPYVSGRLGLLVIPWLLETWSHDGMDSAFLDASTQIIESTLQIGGRLEHGIIDIEGSRSQFFSLAESTACSLEWTQLLWSSFIGSSIISHGLSPIFSSRPNPLRRADTLLLPLGMDHRTPRESCLLHSLSLLDMLLFLDDFSDINEDIFNGDENSCVDGLKDQTSMIQLIKTISRSINTLDVSLHVNKYLTSNAIIAINFLLGVQ